MNPRAEADWCPCKGRADGLIAKGGVIDVRCEDRHIFKKCGSDNRVSSRQSTKGEHRLYLLAGYDVQCIDLRAGAERCPCRGQIDCVVVENRRCEERHLLTQCESGWRVSGRQRTASKVPLCIQAVYDVRCMDLRADAERCPCRGKRDCVAAES